MKNIIALTLSALMLVAALAGCGGTASTEANEYTVGTICTERNVPVYTSYGGAVCYASLSIDYYELGYETGKMAASILLEGKSPADFEVMTLTPEVTMAFLNALPGAVAEGLIWGLMAIGVYISYKILDIADLTVDGSICTGACVCAVLLALGVPAWISVVAALAAGAITGVVTGLLHTRLGIPSILAGILTQLMLYSVNLLILGGKSLVAIDPRANQLLVHMSRNNGSILSLVIIAGITIFLLYEFFYTEIGLTLKSTGDNPDMSRAQGVDVNRNKVVGLAIANGNRLIMLQDGHVVVDVEGEAKQKLTVEDLLKLFAQASGREFSSDRAILS